MSTRTRTRGTAKNAFERLKEDARKHPILSVEEEREYITRWQNERDPAAVQALAGSHMLYVVKLAHRFAAASGFPVDELVAEGNVGLMHALGKYDLEKNNRFSTYAQWWMREA
ncbi:MAG: hypothetical protein MI861_13205, partial [Pirellulales bacterium]|nr:hypothetical protein [Pirellulales bacterium]